MTTTLARRYAALLACAGLLLATPALAQDKTVKIGVLNDMSSLYADIGGPNAVVAIKMAVEDSGLTKKGWKIDVVSADHMNKPDVGVNIARQWIDNDKVDAISDTPNSGVALAVNNLVKEKNAVLLNSGAASADLTGKACTPNTVSFTYDTYMLANGTGKALTKAGGDSWFFLTADYAFGAALERDTTAVVTANGGKVLGTAAVHQRRPFARPQDRTGPDLHGILLLGPERLHPGLVEAVRRTGEQKPDAVDDPGRQLRRRSALPQGHGSARRQST
jgi:branched-chain amino acid transport system substrate-binding protein